MALDSSAGESSLGHQHQALIDASGIASTVAEARGYRSVTERADLDALGFAQQQQRVPALLVPIWGVSGKIETYQIRPDTPRLDQRGRPVKYETPRGARMVLDVPPGSRDALGDPGRPLFITEGCRKADSAVSRGLCCLALLGVWNWRGTNGVGGKTALADWESIALSDREVYLAFDSDVTDKPSVQHALSRLAAFLGQRGAKVRVIDLPSGADHAKVGLDDFFAAGHTVDDLMRLARERGPEPDTSLYFVEGGRTYRRKLTRDGMVPEVLSNFEASVTQEMVLDDGVEITRAFMVEGTLDSGAALRAVRVPAAKFGTMQWITEQWGVRAVVSAGASTRDHLREAIQRLSPVASERRVFTHTGWRQVDGKWVYLMANGAVGREGAEVDIGTDLARYSLPRVPEDPKSALSFSLKLFDVAPLSVTVPLWAAVFRAPLATVFPLDFSLWLEGFTGSLKSTLAALALAHFGDFDRTHLPGAWTSTANQLERRAFVLKDTLFVIDDYAPSGLDAREIETKAARLLRSQGNLAGRARLRADLTERPTFPPRGLILATGEQHPSGQSIVARTLLVEVEREHIRFPELSALQRVTARLPHAMAGYIGWLTPQMDTLPAQLRETFDGARALATSGGHLRVPETLAHLYLGLNAGLWYAEDIGACSASQAEELRESAWHALLALGHAHGQSVEHERPTRRFIRVLLSLLAQGRVVLLNKDAPISDGARGASLLGWQDPEYLYLIPEATYTEVARVCRDAGEPFTTREERLRRDLAREGFTVCDPDRQTKTIRVDGRTHRVLCLKRLMVEELTEDGLASAA